MAKKDILIDHDYKGNKIESAKIINPKIDVGSDAAGDLYYRDASGNFIRLGIGNENDILTTKSGVPSWETASGGTSINYDDMSKYRSNKDSGIFKTIIWKDDNDKMRKKSELSGGTAPNFTTRTITYYDDTETLTDTLVYTLDYDGSDDFTEEVLN